MDNLAKANVQLSLVSIRRQTPRPRHRNAEKPHMPVLFFRGKNFDFRLFPEVKILSK